MIENKLEWKGVLNVFLLSLDLQLLLPYMAGAKLQCQMVHSLLSKLYTHIKIHIICSLLGIIQNQEKELVEKGLQAVKF